MLSASQYHVSSLLGQGGMAKVYLAEHKGLGHKVAIKVLNKEYFYNDNIRKRFLAEARNLAGMNHPNIVRVTDLIEDNETAAFVMEYIEGRTLRDYLEEKGKLLDDEIRHLFGQMLEAVGYVHEQGLIHRDIKPSNFMIDGRGNIKLLDFGIAKTMDESSLEYTQTSTGLQMGTPMYMSPEQVMATKSVTPQSDIYSLGVVLWQMATGTKPFDNKTLSISEIQEKIRKEPLPKTGTNWDDFVKNLTRKDQTKRLTISEITALIQPKEVDKGILETPSNGIIKKWYVVFILFVVAFIVSLLIHYKPFKSNQEWIEVARVQIENKNYSSALDILNKESLKDDTLSNYLLGEMNALGLGIPQDFRKSFEFFRKAAEAGHLDSQFELAKQLRDGLGVAQDPNEALIWLKKAAGKGHLQAAFEVGQSYRFGSGTNQNSTEAVKWLIMAAKNGHGEAQACLGVMYHFGNGVPQQSYSKAKKWYELSVKEKSASGAFCLGTLYLNGLGVPQDYRKAFDFFSEAGSQNYPDALFCLGEMFEKGLGMDSSKVEAIEWYKKAAKFGNSNAINRLNELEKKNIDNRVLPSVKP